MVICDMDCLNCKHSDCINDHVAPNCEKYRSEASKERRRAYDKSRYYRNKSAGLCVKCGKTEARYGVLCYECYLAKKRTDNERRKHLRDNWLSNNLCWRCGDKRMEGHKLCKKHYVLAVKCIAQCNDHPNTVAARKKHGQVSRL